MEDLTQTVLSYVTKEYLEDDETEILPSTPLITGGIVDSFSMVSLRRFLEKKFNIVIPDTEATPAAFDSVNNIVALVTRHLKG